MSTFKDTDAANALRLLAEAVVECNEDLDMYAAEPDLEDTDDDNDSECPVFDTFYEQGGSSSIISMITFNVQEFDTLWRGDREHIMEHFNIERGKKYPHTAKDVLFMTLTAMKHASNWDMIANLCGKKGLTFERLVMRFVIIISPRFYKVLVESNDELYPMSRIIDEKNTFQYFPLCPLRS